MKDKQLIIIVSILFIVSTLFVYYILPSSSSDTSKVGKLYINEVCGNNSNIITDIDNDTSDFIEIYNGYNKDIDLSGYHLSDKEYETDFWTFPSITIKSKSYLIIYASGKNKVVNNEIHTNFKLSSDGEVITLSDKNNSIISKVTYGKTAVNTSFGYNGRKYLYYYIASPGKSNGGATSINSINYISLKESIEITEYMLDNETIYDSDGDYSSFIELYNNGNKDISLNKLFISDSKNNTTKYNLPEIVLKGNQYIVIYTSGKNKYKNNEIHASFKLKEGESIVVSNLSGDIIDSVDIIELPISASYGKKDNKWYYFGTPTPGKGNTTKAFEKWVAK